MKSLSLLKKIALGSSVVAATMPLAFTNTSCGFQTIGAYCVDFNGILFNGDYSTASLGNQPFKQLLFGSNKISNGNYVLFIGSNMSNTTCKFFSGSEYLRESDQWFKTSEQSESGHFWDGDFFLGIEKTKGTPIKNFAIYNVIDMWDGKVYDNKGHQIIISEKPDVAKEIISPWAKWTDQMITQTKLYNKSEHMKEKYEWDEKSVSNKDYIRNDASAVTYRAFNQMGLQIYPTNDKRKKSFDCSDNNNSAKMLVFVDGVLQVKDKEKDQDIWDIPSSKESWYDLIVKYFKDEEKKPEPTPPTPPKPSI